MNQKEKILFKLLGLSALVFTLELIGFYQALGNPRYQPILPLNIGRADKIPLVAETMMDPSLLSDIESSGADIQSLNRLVSRLEERLREGQTDQRINILRNLMEAHVKLSYLYQNQMKNGEVASELDDAYQRASQAAAEYRENVKANSLAAAVATYHHYVSDYLMDRGGADAVFQLSRIKHPSFPGELKTRIDFLTALSDLEKGQRASAQKLEGLLPRLSREGGIAARLAIARSLAGLNRSGNKQSQGNPRYKSYINAATQRASLLSGLHKERVLMFALGVWRGAEGSSANWGQIPVNMSGFTQSPAYHGIAERNALGHISKGQVAQGIKIYRDLTGFFETSQSNLAVALDQRIIAIQHDQYRKTGNVKAYENELESMGSKYQGSGDKNAMASHIEQRHAALVHGELTIASQAHSPKTRRQNAIALAHRYLIKVENTPNAEMIRVKIAELWKLNGDHKNAVRSYLELAQLSKDQKKIQYLNAAISSQRILANWPAVAPWGGMAKGSPSERQQLLAIYSDLIGVYGDRINWDVVSHYGILSLEMGAEDQAFASWNKALSKNPRGPHASFAAGFMMVRYEGTKRWQDLENLARLCMKSGLSPQHRNKVLNPKAMLAMALLEGGKAHFNSGNFKLAVSKLEEFVKGFNTPNRDEGMFFLASAYRGNADHKKAIETLAAFSQQYPQSSYYRQAMLNGGNWSTAMAFEENAIYFHKGFLRRFGDDPEAKKIRPVLTQLYLGRRLYAEVLHVYQGQVDSRTSSNDERLRAMHGIMTIEASYGSMDRAVREADRLLSVTQNENFVADALNVKTKFYHSKNNFAELGRIESRLATMSNNQKVQDALSEVRFLLADRNNEQLFSPIDNLTLKNPLQIIQQRYAAFSKVRSGYEKVCSGGDSAYCAPALNQVARKAEQLLTIVEEVTIPETFDEKTVYGFDREKAKVLNTLASVASKADARASSMIERGFNDPVTTQQVLWQNADDWNFHRVSTEAGHAYIQWPVASKD